MADVNTDDKKNKIIPLIYDMLVFVILIIVVIMRLLAKNQVNWIWIINYLGMVIAGINLMTNRIIDNKTSQAGSLTVLIIIIIFIYAALFFVINFCQKTDFSDLINDIITLVAVLFSVAPNVWDMIFDVIEQYI